MMQPHLQSPIPLLDSSYTTTRYSWADVAVHVEAEVLAGMARAIGLEWVVSSDRLKGGVG